MHAKASRLLLGLLAILLLTIPGDSSAAPADAVVRISSHGASGTVIATGQGWSLILSCAHMLEGAALRKPFRLDIPSPAADAPRQVGVVLLGYDYRLDLSLLRLNAGPLAYVCPVAPAGHRPGQSCRSVGFDEMKIPPQNRLATVLGGQGNTTYTREKPWHGRSGGGLLDGAYLIGVVQGYEVPARGRGMYVSHTAILGFLRKYQTGGMSAPATRSAPAPRPRYGYRPNVRPQGC